jgi:hypothetical protein
MAFSDITAAHVGAAVARRVELETALTSASASRRALETRLTALTSGPSGAALDTALTDARAEITALDARLAGIAAATAAGAGAGGGSGGGPRILSASEKIALKASIDRYKSVWRMRKAAAVEVAGGILDAGGPSVKAFFAQCGVETDEDAKVNLKDL